MDILDDGADGYEKLAKKCSEYDVSTVFRRLSQQRKMFIEELKYECLVQGEELNVSGTVAGFFHRALMDLKAPFVDESNIIQMAIDGEKAAIKVYEENITNHTPRYIKEKLESQLSLIKGAIPQLQNFSHEVAATS